MVTGHELFPMWLTGSGSVVLVGLIGWGWLKRTGAAGFEADVLEGSVTEGQDSKQEG